MKVLLISNMYPSNKYPSYGVFVKNTNDILQKNNFNVEKIVIKKTKNKVYKVLKYLIFYFNILYNLIFKKFDVIYVHYASHCAIPILVATKIKRNIIIYTNVHGSDIVPKNNLQTYLQTYVRKLLKISSKIIVPSNYFKNLVANKYALGINKIFIFPSGGVDTQKFYPINKNKVLKKLNLNIKYKYIGYIGRLDAEKEFDIFLDAIKYLKNIGQLDGKKVIIVGNGTEEFLLKKYIDENRLSEDIIKFNLLPQKQLPYIYNCLDVFCFPTKGESLGLVGLEAMACGIPVIGSKVEALSEYIEDGKNGRLFEVGNPNNLGERLLEYFSLNSNKKLDMKKEARLTAEKYDSKIAEKILINIF